MFSARLLRNFQVQDLDNEIPTLLGMERKEYRKLRNGDPGENGWQKIAKLINNKGKAGFDLKPLENVLFNDISYNLPDHHYIFSIGFDKELTVEKVMSRLQEKNEPINIPIDQYRTKDNNIQLVSVRRQEEDVIFLFRAGTSKDDGDKKVIFFVPCIINLENKICTIKIRSHFLTKSHYNVRGLHNDVIMFLKKFGDLFTVQKYTRPITETILYKFFKEESDRADQIIKNKSQKLTEADLDLKIKSFLKDQFEISSKKHELTYINRIKSVYYQHEASYMENTAFGNRYMFAFSFFDGLSTKSSTRDSARDPVYPKKLYWTLKDIIHDEKKISSVSMYYKFDKNNFDKSNLGDDFTFLQVTFEEKHGTILINYYLGSRDKERKNKSEYVIRELKKHLP